MAPNPCGLTLTGLNGQFPGGALVKNTFLEFPSKCVDEDEDDWIVPLNAKRQWTDSIVERCSQSMQQEKERLQQSQQSGDLLACGAGAPAIIPERRCEEEEAETSLALPHAGAESGESTTVAEESTDDEEALPVERGPRHSAMQAARDLANAGGGLSGHTTVMIRHIACKYTQRKLMREINGAGFMGRFDFFYLPMDPRSHSNRGFAFANFITTEIAEEFYRRFHGQQLRHFNSDKVIAVTPADLQGFDENAINYTSSKALRHKRAPKSRPLFFRPLPEHILSEASPELVAKTQAQQQPFRFCAYCGQPRDACGDSNFCSRCWAPLFA